MGNIIDYVLSVIEETLASFDIGVNIEYNMGNASIRGDVINIYLRFYTSDIFGNTVSIANIAMAESIQCNGIFTAIMENIASIDVVDSVLITGVCSEAMINWCDTNNCMFIGVGNYKYK
jgi:hypothetical protein